MESYNGDNVHVSEKKDHSSFFISNLMFMILAFAFIGLSVLMQFVNVDFKTSIVIIQYGIITVPIFIVMKLTNVDIKKAFRFNRISFKTVFKIVLITLVCLPIAYFLNLVLNVILIKLDLFQVQTMDMGTGTLNFFIMFFLISITPGICEEVFFRGMMLSGYESKMKPLNAIILTGVLFGLFHFNLQNLMLPMFLGVMLALVVYITNSIYSSMILHSLFNAIGLVIMYFVPEVENIEATPAEMEAAMEASIELLEQSAPILLGFLLFVSIICGGLLYVLINGLKKDYIKIEVGDQIVIKENILKVMELDEEIIIVEKELDELKRIKRSSLKNIDYRLVKLKVKKEDGKTYQKISPQMSPWNIIFIGSVVILYIGFTFLIYF